MSNVWIPFGVGIDENSRQQKEDLIRPWANGVVLEIGAGASSVKSLHCLSPHFYVTYERER